MQGGVGESLRSKTHLQSKVTGEGPLAVVLEHLCSWRGRLQQCHVLPHALVLALAQAVPLEEAELQRSCGCREETNGVSIVQTLNRAMGGRMSFTESGLLTVTPSPVVKINKSCTKNDLCAG